MAEKPLYAPAYVARIADPKSQAKSAVLVPRNIGYLSVRITFHREPVSDLEVRFFVETSGGAKGDQVGEPQKTDARGVARLDLMVPVGRYVCAIERQPETAITTVSDERRPHPIPLPVGRPYVDVGEAIEFIPPGEGDEAT
jgi:hypothetical protein